MYRPRAASPAVGVAVLLALTTVLAATVAVGVGVREATAPAPRASVTGSLSADDGWPGGQVVELVHRAGDPLRVRDIALVVTLSRTDRPTRLAGFPTRRLTPEHVRGPAVVDESFAGVDGALDAAYTDGWWESGESAAVRVSSGDYDLRPGETVRLRVVHRPTGAVVARQRIAAT